MENVSIAEETILNRMFLICGMKVMLESDLAELYGVGTKVLDQAVNRNLSRIPEDFMFQLTEGEWTKNLRSVDIRIKKTLTPILEYKINKFTLQR